MAAGGPRWRIPALVAASALGVGVATTVTVARWLHREQLGVQRGAPVIVLEPAWAAAVELEDPPLRVDRAGDAWVVAGPTPHPVDAGAVSRVLADLAGLRRRTTSAPSGESAAEQAYYGLSPPRTTVAVLLGGGVRREIALGARNGADATQFVRTSTGEIAIIPGAAGAALEADLAALRRAAQGVTP
jgi:hypothetical protein